MAGQASSATKVGGSWQLGPLCVPRGHPCGAPAIFYSCPLVWGVSLLYELILDTAIQVVKVANSNDACSTDEKLRPREELLHKGSFERLTELNIVSQPDAYSTPGGGQGF